MSVQVSALYRRGVVRPLDEIAETQLRRSLVASPIRCEWLAIVDSGQFTEIWQSGVFLRIAEACATEIAEYEEVILESHMLSTAIDVLSSMAVASHDAKQFVAALNSLMIAAAADEMPVLFVL
jgi:hypothetical protein